MTDKMKQIPEKVSEDTKIKLISFWTTLQSKIKLGAENPKPSGEKKK